MGNNIPKKVDESAAQAHFDTVLNDHEQAFEKFFLARFLGLDFEYLPGDAADADKDTCRVSFEVTDMLRNPQGSLHGGAMACAMDISMGHLVNKTQGPGATIEMKLQFMRPVVTGRATCEGRFLKSGSSISFMESRLWDAQGKLATIATATWKMP
ncbi:putative thioesterase superfamily protein (plasmid) [Octadecabacter antarcticus 307]|uniref:Putative thioesterase superfamily protein n=2 Tax=Octadecabacter TaxID=53945 RepID=M9RDI4_9RHOB|nr:putative thioesterase superfamily protein [Octadecabacter antarcticus 307]